MIVEAPAQPESASTTANSKQKRTRRVETKKRMFPSSMAGNCEDEYDDVWLRYQRAWIKVFPCHCRLVYWYCLAGSMTCCTAKACGIALSPFSRRAPIAEREAHMVR
jgi:hypothetical protein